jgi:hypothetical protein
LAAATDEIEQLSAQLMQAQQDLQQQRDQTSEEVGGLLQLTRPCCGFYHACVHLQPARAHSSAAFAC